MIKCFYVEITVKYSTSQMGKLYLKVEEPIDTTLWTLQPSSTSYTWTTHDGVTTVSDYKH